MRKLLIALVIAAFAFSGYALAADTDADPAWSSINDYCAVYHIVLDDSGALSNPDTSYAFPIFLHGPNFPMPDYINLKGIFTEIGTNTSGDSVIVNIDVNTTPAAKAAASWTIISATAGDAVYANRTGKADTVVTGTSDASISISYNFTSTMMQQLMPYARIRWDYSEGAAADSFDVDWYVVYLYKAGTKLK